MGRGVERDVGRNECFPVDGHGDIQQWQVRRRRREENMSRIGDVSQGQRGVDEDGHGSGVGIAVCITWKVRANSLCTAQSKQGGGGGGWKWEITAWE